MGRVVNGVHEADRIGGARQGARPSDVVNGAEGIGGRADREQPCPGGEGALQCRPVEPSRGQHERHAPKRHPALARQRLPRREVGVVIELGDHDLVARSPGPPERAAEMERQRRHVGAEDDFGRRGAQEIRQRLASGGDQPSVSLARGYASACWLVLAEIFGHASATACALGARGPEVCNRPSACRRSQSGKRARMSASILVMNLEGSIWCHARAVL